MLTKSQIANIHKLDAQTCIEIMHEYAERLGLVAVDEYAIIMDRPRRSIYADIYSKKLKSIELSKRIFVIINL